MVSQHPAISLFFRANFEKICERALTPLSFGGYSCNIQNLKGRLTATTIGFDIILEPVPDFHCTRKWADICTRVMPRLGPIKLYRAQC